MINKLSVTAFLFFICFSSSVIAQTDPLTINYNVNDDKSVNFSYIKNDPGYYTIKVQLSNLTNSQNPIEAKYSVNAYTGSLLKLTPVNKDQGIGFSYHYSYIRGRLNPRYNANFIYILPCKKGNKVKVGNMGFLGSVYFGTTTPDDWKSYYFSTANEDTVTAVRKGMVVYVKDIYDNEASADVKYKSTLNEITIEHADGTLATYKGFKKGSIVVKPGQIVFPGTILGVNSKYNESSKYGISLLISYLKYVSADEITDPGIKSKSLYGFITAHFCTAESADVLLATQEYAEADTPEIIKKELTKREIKQYIK